MKTHAKIALTITTTMLLLTLTLASLCTAAQATPTTNTKTITLTKNRPGYYTISITYPQFTPSSALLTHANKHYKQLAYTYFNTSIKKAEELARAGKPIQPSLFTLSTTVAIARPDITSVYLYGYTYLADHINGYQTCLTENLGITAGKPTRLTYTDIFNPNTKNALQKEILTRLKQTPNYQQLMQGIPSASSPNLLKTYVITPKGIAFIIPISELTTSSINGPQTVIKIPYDQLKPYLRPNSPLKPLQKAPHTPTTTPPTAPQAPPQSKAPS